MPTPDDIERATSALRYPFSAPQHSYVLIGSEVIPIVKARPDALHESEVELDGVATSLQQVLRSRGLDSAETQGRTPVLSYGANRSPKALARKLRDCRSPVAVAMAVDVSGLDVCYSAHVTTGGTVPATIVRSRGTTVSVFVLFLDDEQLEFVHRTEHVGVNYAFQTIGGVSIRFEDGTVWDEVASYIGMRGALLLDRQPIGLAAIEARARVFPDLTERELMLELLATHEIEEGTVEEFVLRLRADSGMRRHLTGELADRSRPFGKTHPSSKEPFVVKPTSNRSPARGDYLVCVSPGTRKRLRLRSHAVVQHSPDALGGSSLAVVCRVDVDPTLADWDVLTDQTVRHALGIPYLGERAEETTVDVAPLKLTFPQRVNEAFSVWLGRRYLLVRAVKCDVADLEKDICRMSCDTFNLIGCDSGDRIVVQAPTLTPEGTWVLSQTRVDAYEAGEDWIAQRRNQEESRLSARYPAIAQILGVQPDVPHLYCDLHVRQHLGNLKLMRPAAVRRDIRYLFQKRFVDFGLIFLLSLVAIVQILPVQSSWALLGISLLVSAVVSTGVVLLLLRSSIH